ncbi:hypothetical protein M918_19565 [Clostridium sp. BL8]|uniref:TetR/AcrR family transcriptional regulator n=1 Tax=Clostridium sp. BL8 TaxID=1354301 RepID=UPI00038A38D0|nr:TetR/AcrR family transcriptional regulator [Clostridium sp. BL8]EQB89643.1 hypothetical protein M918_19565 [Clostridium sp. BL8]
MDMTVKERILIEANKVIAEKGLNRFTLEEVAKEAGVSKGGLLHYYPSKDKLIKGLIENYIVTIEAKVSETDNNRSKDTSHNWLISFIHEQFNQCKIDSTTMYGLLAAVASNQELLEPVLEKRKEWFEKIGKSKDPILSIVISFACDGISFFKSIGFRGIS